MYNLFNKLIYILFSLFYNFQHKIHGKLKNKEKSWKEKKLFTIVCVIVTKGPRKINSLYAPRSHRL